MEEKYLIPRNVIDKQDTFPIDMIVHIEIEKRQIPYLFTGVAIAVAMITLKGNIIPAKMIVDGVVNFRGTTISLANANIAVKTVMGVVNFGSSLLLSMFKVENQYLEELLNNLLKYNRDLIKFKIERSKNNECKNIENRVFKFKIKES